MGLEIATYISDLNANNPVGAVDPVAQGDDHIRLIKAALKNTFPNLTGALTLTQAELNGAALLARNDQVFTGAINRFQNNNGGQIALVDGDAAVGQKIFTLRSINGQFAIAPTTDGLSVVENGFIMATNAASEVTNMTLAGDNLAVTASGSVAFTTPAINGINTILNLSGTPQEKLNLRANAAGDLAIAYMAWRDSAGVRLGYLGKSNGGDAHLYWVGEGTAQCRISATAIMLNNVNVLDYARLSQVNTFAANQIISAADGVITLELRGASGKLRMYGHSGGAYLTAVNTAGTVATPLNFQAEKYKFVGGYVETDNLRADEPGFKGMPQFATAFAAYTLALSDAGKHISAQVSVTVPADATVNFPIGTVITIVGQIGYPATVAITPAAGVTMRWAGVNPTSDGARTLAGNQGLATLIKYGANFWLITGPSLS